MEGISPGFLKGSTDPLKLVYMEEILPGFTQKKNISIIASSIRKIPMKTIIYYSKSE